MPLSTSKPPLNVINGQIRTIGIPISDRHLHQDPFGCDARPDHELSRGLSVSSYEIRTHFLTVLTIHKSLLTDLKCSTTMVETLRNTIYHKPAILINIGGFLRDGPHKEVWILQKKYSKPSLYTEQTLVHHHGSRKLPVNGS